MATKSNKLRKRSRGAAKRTARDCRDFLAELEHELPTRAMKFSGRVAGVLSRRLTEDFGL